MKFTITRTNPDIGYQDLAKAIESKLEEKGYCNVKVMDDKRGLDANAQMHVWISHIAHETGQDIQTVTLTNKRFVGLPIVLNGDMGEKVAWTLNKVGFWNWPDKSQVEFMEMLPVTSIMTSKEHTIMRDNMQGYWQERCGVILEYLR